MAKKKQQIVPESHKVLDQWKYEIAAEMGLPVGLNAGTFLTEFASELGEIPTSSRNEDYWGHISSRDTGAVGGAITRRLIQQAEETLFTL